eukprot:TRINITY_DN10122_c0_g1_i1.p1 TRINITY_DN10122_c0_g1~~TRINITY_DN10122_c0_g1_i1.p1  ORF type:complete len:867 (+),score=100.64 TRINITY_DN10122_c0_g1_i1:224-2602(+)
MIPVIQIRGPDGALLIDGDDSRINVRDDGPELTGFVLPQTGLYTLLVADRHGDPTCNMGFTVLLKGCAPCCSGNAQCTSSSTIARCIHKEGIYERASADNCGADEVCCEAGDDAACVKAADCEPCPRPGNKKCTSSHSFRTCLNSAFGSTSIYGPEESCGDGTECCQSGGSAFCVPEGCCPSEPECPESGRQKCLSSTTYTTCSLAASGFLAYEQPQTCQEGLVCCPTGHHVYCVRPHECPSLEDKCSHVGDQKCMDKSSYKTCLLSITGAYAYGETQQCRDGLVCCPSGDEIYCVKPEECPTESDCEVEEIGNQKCLSPNTFSTCAEAITGFTAFGVTQQCQEGLVCCPSGKNIYCVRPEECPEKSDCHKTGAQKCLTNTSYSTCAASIRGFPAFGVEQPCQEGLVCCPDGDHVYCVRPEECPLTDKCEEEGQAKCLTPGTYCTCRASSSGALNFGPSQACAKGLVCCPDGKNIYCVRPEQCPEHEDYCEIGSKRCNEDDSYSVCEGSKDGCSSYGPATYCPDGLKCCKTGDKVVCASYDDCHPKSDCEVVGHQKCLSGDTYKTCGYSLSGFPAYGPDQSCGEGLVCCPSGDHIYCVRPSECPSTGDQCSSIGKQKCVGSDSYSTCSNSVVGFPAFGEPQKCQDGLICCPSANGNIYCVRPEECPSECDCDNIGDQQCLTSNTYNTCANSIGGFLAFGVPQECQPGLVCCPSGRKIYCVRPEECPAKCDECSKVGIQKCISSTSYSTCANAISGVLAYGVEQNCQPGLICCPFGENIYCVRPGECPYEKQE